MARSRLRPRVLNGALGGYILVIVVIAWWFANSSYGSGYVYGPETTRWAFLAYMVTAAALLSGIASAAVSGMHHMDRRLDEVEAAMGLAAPAAAEEPSGDSLPPPLEEVTVERDHVDKDIDELLVSLQEIETSAGGVDEAREEVVAEISARPAVAARAAAHSPKVVEALKLQRRQIPAFFAGPALAMIGIIGIGAIMLPGVDAMLQTYHELNTALVLGIGYSFPGIALFTGAAFFAVLRRK